MIDIDNPIPTPFRVDWTTEPRVDYGFKTGVITAADGREQRYPQNRYPRLAVSYACMPRFQQHADRIDAMIPEIMNSALVIRDFRMNAQCRVSADGWSVILREWQCSWAAGVRILVEDDAGMAEHATTISSVDPVSRTIILAERAPFALRGGYAGVFSAVVASVDGNRTSDRVHANLMMWDLGFNSFGGVDPIGGAHLPEFPFTHGQREGIKVTHNRSIGSTDYGVGRRSEFLTYSSATSGFRTYQVETLQMSQDDKERLVSFFAGCGGRHRSFAAPLLVPDARFRFGSDTLAITHTSGNASKATLNLVQVIQ